MGLEFNFQYFTWAVALGVLSAASLPLGSALGLVWQPRARITAALTAFGGGALIAALALELVAPTAADFIKVSHSGDLEARHEAAGNLLSLIVSALIGGCLFLILNEIINAKGGFLRKTATTISFMSRSRAKRNREILQQLAKIKVLHTLPPEHIEMLVESVRPQSFDAGEVLFEEGTAGDRMYFIETGIVELVEGGDKFKELAAGETLGEIALLTGAPRTATARAKDVVDALVLDKGDFDRLRRVCPELDEAARALAEDRLDELASFQQERATHAAVWASQAVHGLRNKTTIPSPEEVLKAKESHSGAPLAIWLGILLDGIPESFVIGASLLATTALLGASDAATFGFLAVVPYTLIAGLFLSNFPEAMSSSIGMGKQGMSKSKIFLMWFSLVIVTALGAGVGYWLGGAAPEWVVVGIEGLAAGAMLTMIASTMVPEAVHLGGANITGLGTLTGFLVAVSFKFLE